MHVPKFMVVKSLGFILWGQNVVPIHQVDVEMFHMINEHFEEIVIVAFEVVANPGGATVSNFSLKDKTGMILDFLYLFLIPV